MTASRTRWAISLLAILGTLPYIGLKLLWLAGSRVGIEDPDFGGVEMWVANALTMGLDLVAVGMALAFVMPFGQRIRSWLVLCPMWVGTGFLGQVLVVVPLQLLLGTPATEESGDGPLAEWVFTMVYAGFMWQGVFLLTGFVLYARARWSAALSGDAVGRPGPDEAPAVLPALGLSVLGGLATIAHVVGVFDPAAANIVGEVLLSVAAVAGLALLAGWWPGTPRWAAVVLAWLGSGAMFAWGCYLLVVMLVPNDLVGDATVRWTDLLAEALKVAGGVATAVTGAWLLRRRLGGVRAGPAPDAAGEPAAAISPSAASASPTA